MNIAIIPARGGSKRIPNKNIKLFAGVPIIAHSIKAAKASNIFHKIIVSTDSEQIARVAQDFGAEVPFMRPEELSGDYISTAAVLLHAIKWFEEHGFHPEYSCCIYATAPFVSPFYLQKGFELIKQEEVTSAFSVTTFSFPIFRSLKITDSGYLNMYWPEYEMSYSHDLPGAYHDAGQFYWNECASFLREQKLYSSQAKPVILPRYLVQDIDTPEDWENAEIMYELCKKRGFL